MFDPTLTDDQKALCETARRFAAEKIVPVAGGYDESGDWPEPVFADAWELGLMNVEVPEAFGGLGFSTLDGCLISDELAFGCAGMATSIMGNHLASLPLLPVVVIGAALGCLHRRVFVRLGLRGRDRALQEGSEVLVLTRTQREGLGREGHGLPSPPGTERLRPPREFGRPVGRQGAAPPQGRRVVLVL